MLESDKERNSIESGRSSTGKKPQGLGFPLVINEDILFRSDQKGDAFAKKLPSAEQPETSPRSMMSSGRLSTGKRLIDRQNQGMLQNDLALLDHPIREAGKSHGKDSSLKDQSHQQGWNPSDGRLIENQGPSFYYGLKTADKATWRGSGFRAPSLRLVKNRKRRNCLPLGPISKGRQRATAA